MLDFHEFSGTIIPIITEEQKIPNAVLFSKVFTNLFKSKNDGELKTLFTNYSQLLVEGTNALDQLLNCSTQERPAFIQKINRLRGDADTIKKQINEFIDHAFIISWIDKYDATHLVNDLDACIRSMRKVAKYTQIYQVDTILPQVKSIFQCIVSITKELPDMMEGLIHAHYDIIIQRQSQIEKLESEADELCSSAITALWQEENSKNSLHVIKWERIFQGLERITDHGRDLADTMLSIARSAQ